MAVGTKRKRKPPESPPGAVSCSAEWSGRSDSNARPPEPHFGPAHVQEPHTYVQRVHSVEPELAHYIMAAAKEVASSMMLECEMPRPVAMRLCERISALALSVYGAYNLAVYEHYKDLLKDTDVAALDSQPEPPFPPTPPPPPSNGEQGGTCGVN